MSHRDFLLRNYENGNFLETIYSISLANGNDDDTVSLELVVLHNEGQINVVDAFNSLKSEPSSGSDFFLMRYIFEKVLPEIECAVLSVMRCVLHLYREAGQDLAAGTIFEAYIDFCAKDPSRSIEALANIEENPNDFADLLPATLIAGSRINHHFYLAELIRLCKAENIELRKRAIFSLGRLHWLENIVMIDSALAALERSIEKEIDDEMLGNIVKSAYELLRHDKRQEARVIAVIGTALSKGNEYTLHSASEIFGFSTDALAAPLLELLLVQLMHVKPLNKGTLHNLDFGISHLLKNANSEKAIHFLENLLLKHPTELSMDIFCITAEEILNNKILLSKILTRWFLKGDRALCNGIHTIIGRYHGGDIQLEVDLVELKPADFVHIVFIARKAIGYLFMQPISASSFIISLMRNTSNNGILTELGELLFDPLLLSFTGKVREFVVHQCSIESGKVKTTIEKVLKKIDDYLEDLHSIGNLAALHPSEAHREAYHRQFSHIMAESQKAAEAKSVFQNLFSQSILLYGRKSINYVYDSDEQPHRMEIPLQCHGIEMEFPRLDNIDSFGLDYTLRVFRNEQINL
jgi:hypothetical protein